MKLKNKRTGEIIAFNKGKIILDCNDSKTIYFNSLEDLEEWEEYEEPKGFWHITVLNGVLFSGYMEDPFTGIEEKKYKEIGNYFETKEEAKKALEKLKALKRLKSHNLRIERGQRIFVNADNKLVSQKPLFVVDTYEEVEDDLDLLFGGEE